LGIHERKVAIYNYQLLQLSQGGWWSLKDETRPLGMSRTLQNAVYHSCFWFRYSQN
jgi:hypothetical protein